MGVTDTANGGLALGGAERIVILGPHKLGCANNAVYKFLVSVTSITKVEKVSSALKHGKGGGIFRRSLGVNVTARLIGNQHIVIESLYVLVYSLNVVLDGEMLRLSAGVEVAVAVILRVGSQGG